MTNKLKEEKKTLPLKPLIYFETMIQQNNHLFHSCLLLFIMKGVRKEERQRNHSLTNKVSQKKEMLSAPT